MTSPVTMTAQRQASQQRDPASASRLCRKKRKETKVLIWTCLRSHHPSYSFPFPCLFSCQIKTAYLLPCVRQKTSVRELPCYFSLTVSHRLGENRVSIHFSYLFIVFSWFREILHSNSANRQNGRKASPDPETCGMVKLISSGGRAPSCLHKPQISLTHTHPCTISGRTFTGIISQPAFYLSLAILTNPLTLSLI